MQMFDFQANRELFFIYGETAYVYNYGNGSWYMYTNFGGKHFCVCGKLVYFARGADLCMFGNDKYCALEEQSLWVSNYITGGVKGDFHPIKLDADLHIHSNSNVRFEFAVGESKSKTVQEIVFPKDADNYLRLTMRPRWKRAMPFKIKFIDMGAGNTALHGLILTIKNNERKRRNGIL